MAVPKFDHIVVVVMENHDYNQIIGNPAAPYINSLASKGSLLTNYHAISHPSEPNYFALYAGSTFGVTNDNPHREPDPTLAAILRAGGKTFTGYVEGGNSSYDHNPWEAFPEGFSVEKNFNTFPSGTNFSSLPNVSFVIPNVSDDMHDGSIQRGDTWLKDHLSAYAQWATSHNSLLVVTWDENNGASDGNHVATILSGANVQQGTSAIPYNHYDLLSMLAASNGLIGPRLAAKAAPIDVFRTVSGPLAGSVNLTAGSDGRALPATSGTDPGSSGLFQLTGGSEATAALGTETPISFLGSNDPAGGAAGSWGMNVGSTGDAGLGLQDFGAGNTMGLKQFGAAGAAPQFNPADGVLPTTNGAAQHVSPGFPITSLGADNFHTAYGGNGGTFV